MKFEESKKALVAAGNVDKSVDPKSDIAEGIFAKATSTNVGPVGKVRPTQYRLAPAKLI